jgi:hypothetical protein
LAFDYDKLVDRSFIRDPEGRLAYFPWGTLLRGYWIDSDSREATLRATTRRFYRIMRIAFPVIFIGTIAVGNFLSPSMGGVFLLLALAGIYVPWRWTIRHLTNSLEHAPRPPKPANTASFFERVAARMSYRQLMLSLTFFVFLIASLLNADVGQRNGLVILSTEFFFALLPAYLLAVLIVKLWKHIPTEAPTPQQQFSTLAWRPVWIVICLGLALSLVLAYYVAMHGG